MSFSVFACKVQACNTRVMDLDDFPFEMTVLALPTGVLGDWSITFSLGDPSHSLSGMQGYEISLALGSTLPATASLSGRWDQSWCRASGLAFTASAQLNSARDSLKVRFLLDNCGSASGFGEVGRIELTGSGGSFDPKAHLRLVKGIVMVDNINGKVRPENADMETLSLYPNPASQRCAFDPHGREVEVLRLSQTDGQTLKAWDTITGPVHLDTSDLPVGVYLLEARLKSGKRKVFRLLVQH
ncbi:MAG TPA: hypothetical protein ENJ82_14685 [Bacteroidetes bacterium]|nr:hypothetical protein [Bacteroidota bacterium]